MVKFFTQIEPDLAEWAMKQQVFFVASAPLQGKHINLSPKGLPSSSFSILSPNQCAYVDATGSGIETISHIQENGRCTVMFCSFETSPRIMRFFCRGRVVAWNEPGFDGWLERMGGKKVTGARAVVVLDVYKAQTSCGFAVPYLSLKPDPDNKSQQIPYLSDRQTLGHWAGKQIENATMNEYRANWNRRSLDGLPGLRIARKDFGERMLWVGDAVAEVRKWNVAGLLLLVLVAVGSSLVTVLVLWALRVLDLTRFEGVHLGGGGIWEYLPSR